MKKKLCSICLAVMVIVTFCTTVLAAGGRVYFSDLTKSADSVSVKARFDGAGSQSVWLIASYVNEKGVITAIREDHAEVSGGGEEILNVTLEDKSSDSVLKCFLWDGLNGRTPLDNVAPAPVADLAAADKTTDSISLEWVKAADDYDSVVRYDVYNMGMKVGSTTDTSFTDTYLQRGSSNTYEVISIDDEGLASPPSVAAVSAENIPTAICAGKQMISDGRLEYVIDENYNHYGSSAATEADGLPCRRTVNPKADGLDTRDIITRHPFKFGAEYAAELEGESEFTLILTYFDNFSGAIRTEYGKQGTDANGLGASTQIAATNTGRWKTVAYNIANAEFSRPATNEGNSYAKIRIYTDRKDFMIYSLSVVPTAAYQALLKNAVASIDGAYIEDGVLLNLTAADGPAKAAIAQQGAALIPAGGQLECDVTAGVTSADTSVCVELEYYTETENEEILLAYNSQTGGAAKEVKQVATAAAKWQRMRFVLTDAAFSNAISGTQLKDGADLIISTNSGSPIYIHSVRVFKK